MIRAFISQTPLNGCNRLRPVHFTHLIFNTMRFLFLPWLLSALPCYGQSFYPSLSLREVIGDTLRCDLGGPVFDLVFTSDTTLYWKSLNPRYGTEGHEKMAVSPVGYDKSLIVYQSKDQAGMCWHLDFYYGTTTLAVLSPGQPVTFSGKFAPKIYMVNRRTITGKVTDENNEPLIGGSVQCKLKDKKGRQVSFWAITDINGNYSISIPQTARELQASFDGYSAQTIAVSESGVVNASLKPSYSAERPRKRFWRKRQ